MREKDANESGHLPRLPTASADNEGEKVSKIRCGLVPSILEKAERARKKWTRRDAVRRSKNDGRAYGDRVVGGGGERENLEEVSGASLRRL